MADGLLEMLSQERPHKHQPGGRRRKPDEDIVIDPIPQLSAAANSVVARCCSRILHLSSDKLQQSFATEFPECVIHSATYARDFFEYCCFRALRVAIKHPTYLLANKEFRKLTFDMMLAWEFPGAMNDLLPKKITSYDNLEVQEEQELGASAQVDDKKVVGLRAFARIAPACPAIADSITVHNLFDALTSSSGGRMHFFTYKNYLKSLQKEIKSAKNAKNVMGSLISSRLHLSDGELILDVDGIMPAQPILQRIGKSTRPGRLTLTTHALYFELYSAGYGEAVKYDLATDLEQVVKGELTGPFGGRLFDKAIMYESTSLAEPIYFGFPEIEGHSRRDYWLALVREVLQVHKFIRKYDLDEIQKMECLSKVILGIFRFRALKQAFHFFPPRFKSVLAFNLTEKIPKGDKVLGALYAHLELYKGTQSFVDSLSEDLHIHYLPFSLYTVAKMSFMLKMESCAAEKYIPVGDVCVGSISSLYAAVEESFSYSEAAEAASATKDQVKMERISKNLAVMKELLFPVLEWTKLLKILAKWEDPVKSTIFLVLNLYLIYRGWIRYILSSTFLSLALCMIWHKLSCKWKPSEAFRIRPLPRKTAAELILLLHHAISHSEIIVHGGNVVLLKLRALLFARAPKATEKIAFTLVATAILIAFVPLECVVVLFVLEALTREMPLRKQSTRKFNRRLFEWWARIPAAPVELIRAKDNNNNQNNNNASFASLL